MKRFYLQGTQTRAPVRARARGHWWHFRLSWLALMVNACAIASAPLSNTPKVAATPIQGDLSVRAQAGKPIGDVVPVYVSLANGTEVGRSVQPSQIFAIDATDNRIAPIPPAEAARQAGGSESLSSALKSGAASGLIGGGIGAALGAIGGAVFGGVGPGAALGGVLGAGESALSGAMMGPGQAQSQASQQIGALALPATEVRKDFSVGGYVFFPKGNYQALQVLVVNDETGATETIKLPWH
ncbi:MAG TPA: hypothetical protein VKV28_17185 [Candidatus Binataceae bacterium]|nr:hypothetical protein [Candidatus Binataceae bacterium]